MSMSKSVCLSMQGSQDIYDGAAQIIRMLWSSAFGGGCIFEFVVVVFDSNFIYRLHVGINIFTASDRFLLHI